MLGMLSALRSALARPGMVHCISRLVKSAMGFDEKRGDHVDVVSMRFVTDDILLPEPSGFLGVRLEKPDLMRLAQTALLGIIGLLALLLVLRPMVMRLTALAPGGMVLTDGTAAGGALLTAAGGIPAIAGPNGMAALPAPGRNGGDNTAGAQTEDEVMVTMAQMDGQVRASSLRKLADIVNKHPDETLTIMRGWMAQENG